MLRPYRPAHLLCYRRISIVLCILAAFAPRALSLSHVPLYHTPAFVFRIHFTTSQRLSDRRHILVSIPLSLCNTQRSDVSFRLTPPILFFSKLSYLRSHPP
jgi:hypothetical protein